MSRLSMKNPEEMRHIRVPSLSRNCQKRLVFSALLAVSLAFFSSPLFAATLIWKGSGSTDNVNEAQNWNLGRIPSNGDSIWFDSTSSENCTINVSLFLERIRIFSGYKGTITQANGVTIFLIENRSGSGDVRFEQADGRFIGSNGSITISGPDVRDLGFFKISGGTFTAGNQILDVEKFEISGGTFNLTIATLQVGQNIPLITPGRFYEQSGGFFNGGSGLIKLNAGMELRGGNFKSTSGRLQVSRDIFFSGDGIFTHNSGLFEYQIESNASFKPNGATFANLLIKKKKEIVFPRAANVTFVENFQVEKGFFLINPESADLSFTPFDTREIKVQGSFNILSSPSAGALNFGNNNLTLNLTNGATGFFMNDVNSNFLSKLKFSGSVDVEIDVVNGNFSPDSIVVDRPVGEVRLKRNLSVGGTPTFDITQGIFNLNGFHLTFDNSVTLSNTGTFRLQGSETVASLSNDINSGTVKYIGGGSNLNLGQFSQYFDVQLNGADSVYTLNQALDVEGSKG